MAITNITNANTFGQWLSTTQSLVSVANSLTDGPILTANTLLRLTHAGETLNVVNTATFTGNVVMNGTVLINGRTPEEIAIAMVIALG